MKFSIATVSLGGAPPEKLTAIAKAGFEGVEIFEADVLAHEVSPPEIGGSSATTAWTSSPSSRSATSRACPSRSGLAGSSAPAGSSS